MVELIPQMSSSFDKEGDVGVSYGGRKQRPSSHSQAARTTGINSPRPPTLFVDSHSQPSVAEISLANTGSREEVVSSFDDSIIRGLAKHNGRSGSRSVVAVGGGVGSGGARMRGSSIKTHSRDDSTSSEESGIFPSEKRRRDPVGDVIASMLNEGRVPHFGYPPTDRPTSALVAEDGFKVCPLFTARNYRATRELLRDVWNGHRGMPSPPQGERRDRRDRSVRFLLESFAVCYVAVYSANDIVLRLLAEISLFGAYLILSLVLFDVEEIKRVVSPLRSSTPTLLTRLVGRLNAVTLEMFGIVEREFLWGQYFQGRSFLWSDDERLVRFRRRHRRLLVTYKELKQKKKESKKVKADRRRREKRGKPFTPSEMEKMEKGNDARDQLETSARQLVLRPPTFLPDRISADYGSDVALQGDATKRHLESLQYCHKTIFSRNWEHQHQDELKPVTIKATGHARTRSSALSPKEAIEVVDQFPDIGSEVNADGSDESVSAALSDDCSAGGYDRKCSDYSSQGEEDDESSLASYASEYSARSMPWVVVGAKIGHKLLTARKLRRVISHAEAPRGLVTGDAKKLISSINNNDEVSSPESLPSTTAQSWEGPSTGGEDMAGGPTSPVHSLPKARSIDLPEIKPPVHRMWTSPGSAALTPSSYGAVTLEASPPRGASPPLGGVCDNANGAAHVATPSRRQRNGPRPTPPPSPKIELLQWGGYFSGAYRTPSPLIDDTSSYTPNLSLTKEETVLSTTITPPLSNASTRKKMFSFNESSQDPPVPVARLAPIEKGVKMVVPMFPPNCQTNASAISGSSFYQMGTVISSRRVCIPHNNKSKLRRRRRTNCLSVKVVLDKALLRGSNFMEMNLIIMDEWNYIPRHSKFPIGSCVATTFGVGVLVGWRVEDDMHIIRSLWNRSGPGSGRAYLRRDSIHSVVEAAVGYDVQTTYGAGKVVAYVKGGKTNTYGKYFVRLKGRHRGPTLEFNRCQILSCQGATFVPVTEHIRDAALYRLEVIHYKSKIREQMLNGPSKGIRNKGMWRNFSEYVDLFANSFSKAIAEDPDFDKEVDKFVSHIINLLDEKKGSNAEKAHIDSKTAANNISICPSSPISECQSPSTHSLDGRAKNDAEATVGWNINDMFGCFFVDPLANSGDRVENQDVLIQAQAFEEAHDSAEILIRVLLRTITVARASVPDRPKLHMALSTTHEALLFVRQILRVQKKHTSRKLIEAWFRALSEISTTFGPLKQRTAALGVQIAKKFRKHGNIAKRRILRFVDIILGDTQLLHALELGEWKKSFLRLESAIVKAGITDAATCEQLHKGVIMMYKNLAPRKKDRKSKAAAARNEQKMVNFGKLIKVFASPGRSFIRLLTRDEVLSIFDRVLVRIFEKDPHCSMVINIYAWNFESLRHLRILNNMPIAGKLWETVLDAIDEELTFATSEIPEQTKYFIEPFVKLFSLGVSQFHCIQSGDSYADWLEFLMQDDAVKIIQELDYKLIDSLEALCTDIKQVVQVLPYIKTIDNDILNLMDEFNFDLFLKEITDVIGDSEKSMRYITERSAILVERFLDYLPRMSVPIERRELQDGWVLTCRSKDGGDLRLSDLSVLRENLHLSVLGSENVFHPSSDKGNYIGSPRNKSPKSPVTVGTDLTDAEEVEESVLDEVKELILSAQSHGSWTPGVGGLKESYRYKGVPPPLNDVPLSDKLKTQIDLWQTSAITDFELLETAIHEVSYQIQLQQEREENGIEQSLQKSRKRFNPRMDPTVLYLDIKNLTLRLDDFGFRVEKGKPVTIFDPVFEGCGSITVTNVSITLKVEVKKERVFRGGLETPRPVLQLAKFEVGLEKLKLEFMETGADWILNAVLKGFSNKITDIVRDNLKEQIVKQVHVLLEQVNGFIDTNPDLLMNVLGITMRDIEESIVCV